MGSTNALQINSLITALVAKIITLRIWRYICSYIQASFWLRNLLDLSLTSATNWGWTGETNVNQGDHLVDSQTNETFAGDDERKLKTRFHTQHGLQMELKYTYIDVYLFMIYQDGYICMIPLKGELSIFDDWLIC